MKRAKVRQEYHRAKTAKTKVSEWIYVIVEPPTGFEFDPWWYRLGRKGTILRYIKPR